MLVGIAHKGTASTADFAPGAAEVHSEPRTLYLFWGYLALATAGELTTSLLSVPAGMGLHIVLLIVLLVHGVLGAGHAERKLALVLTLAPLIRLLSLLMPLVDFPQLIWYPLVAIPLFVAAWIISQQAGVTRRDAGLRLGNVPLQIMLYGGGITLGILEFFILRPAPVGPVVDLPDLLLGSVSLIIFTGFAEELIFRGLMQTSAMPILGKWALPFVSLLFGVLHVGYLSLLDVIYVTVVGYLFALVAKWSGSILGVTLMHGLANITLFIVMPSLTSDPSGPGLTLFYLAALISTLVAVWAACMLRLDHKYRGRPVPR